MGSGCSSYGKRVEATSFSEMMKKKGQAVLEFVLVLPLLLVLIVGAIELGRVFFAKIIITNAAREGAYYLSTHCTEDPTFTDTYQAVKDEANNSGLDLVDADITVVTQNPPVTPPKCKVGQPVIITVETSVANVYLLSFLNNTYGVSSSRVSYQIESEVQMVAYQ